MFVLKGLLSMAEEDNLPFVRVSRQLMVFGGSQHLAIRNTKVLILGFSGLGFEIGDFCQIFCG